MATLNLRVQGSIPCPLIDKPLLCKELLTRVLFCHHFKSITGKTISQFLLSHFHKRNYLSIAVGDLFPMFLLSNFISVLFQSFSVLFPKLHKMTTYPQKKNGCRKTDCESVKEHFPTKNLGINYFKKSEFMQYFKVLL